MTLAASNADIIIDKGTCHVVFAYDVGVGIDLDEADQRITEMKERGRIKRKRSTPEYFDYRPPPLRIMQESDPIMIGEHSTQPWTDVLLYDFGAMSVSYRIPLEGHLLSLLPLSERLYENVQLLGDSRQRVEKLLATLGPAVDKSNIAPFVEDYTIFHLEQVTPKSALIDLMPRLAQRVAQILRCERESLSEQEVCDVTSCQVSFGLDDSTIIDWNGALIVGSEMEDVIAVLEFANVELLERRYLDDQLDKALDNAYEILAKLPRDGLRWPGSYQPDLRRIARLQVDSALLYERVANALKLLGDQFLARVYRLTSQRFHLSAWDESIQRKLETLESIYGKMADQTGNQRMEVLEWIIIILIAVSIILPFIPGFPGY